MKVCMPWTWGVFSNTYRDVGIGSSLCSKLASSFRSLKPRWKPSTFLLIHLYANSLCTSNERLRKKYLHKISKQIPSPLPTPLYTHCRFMKSVSYKMLQMDETASNWTLIFMTNVSLQIIYMKCSFGYKQHSLQLRIHKEAVINNWNTEAVETG